MAIWTAEHFSYEMISEYAREYLAVRKEYNIEDLNAIAKEQYERNNACEKLIIDTEMLVMKIWCEEKFTNCSTEILSLYEEQQIDHYFLCKPDVPWEEDPLRENPSDRDRLFERYKESLLERRVSFNILSGGIEVRKMSILNTLKNLNML